MRFIVPTVPIIVAAIHVLPVAGTLGAGKLTQFYGLATVVRADWLALALLVAGAAAHLKGSE